MQPKRVDGNSSRQQVAENPCRYFLKISRNFFRGFFFSDTIGVKDSEAGHTYYVKKKLKKSTEVPAIRERS